MKKLLSIILVITLSLTLLLTLCSCKSGNVTDDPVSEVPETTTRSLTVRLTFPEGYTISEIAQKLEENEVCSAADFRAAANNADIAANYSFYKYLTNAESRAFLLEGYVYPDTYDFFYGESAEKAIKRFLSNAQNKLDGLEARAAELGYTLDEIMTVASVVQEEATPEQMKKVASVIYNRLSQGMQLQCDVSIAYLNNSVIPFMDGDVNRYNSLYNTYKCKALPAGPICCPGMDAVNAALYPDDTEYLFFVTDKADPSVFYYAVTYEEHLTNCTNAGW